ncbi:glycosyltransferase [Marinobacter piscensis]|uniref:glycosyltransferase n=1 Tax=Marinobacter piscensis TaxID=1562308 RepID=UPI00119DE1D6|nr:glycosyltransferase [Marinobacter piscensis]
MATTPADLQGTKVLFIAYFYPPTESTGVPGSMRTVKFIRNLENGERHVLTTPERVTQEADALAHMSLPVNGEKVHRVAAWDIFRLLLSIRSGLRRLIGKGKQSGKTQGRDTPAKSTFKSSADSAEISRSQKLKDFVYDLSYFPDQAGPWIVPAFLKGRKLVRQHNLDVIFATGSPWSGLITGYLISKTTGKPLVVDFRDPWVNNPFHQSKGKLLDRWGAALEKKVVNHAAAVSLNTEPLMEEFVQRYPELESDKFFVMPNGIDQRDFEHVRQQTHQERDKNTLSLCHAGFLYGVRDPAPLLDALRKINKALEGKGQRITFTQIGDVSLDYDIRHTYSDLIEKGLLVLEPAKPYQACLQLLAAADIVINIQSGTKTQIPSKLYDYLAINRPILHLTPKTGALGRLVERYQLGTCIEFESTEELENYLSSKATELARGELITEEYPNRKRFLIEKISQTLANILARLAEKHKQLKNVHNFTR